MKTIKLTKGQIAIVDDDDFERLNKYKWRAKQDYKNCYAVKYSYTVNGKDVVITMHREILNAPKEYL